MTDEPQFPRAYYEIAKKRDELLSLRRDLFQQIKGIERDVAALEAAIRVFDPGSYASRKVRERKIRRTGVQTQRFVLDFLREAQTPPTCRELTDKWLERLGLEPSPANRKAYTKRMSNALNVMKRNGLTVPEHGTTQKRDVVWRLVE